ncbi:MAG: ubiquitin-like domain-containing protein [Anaerolineae bacterium]
MSAKSFKIAGSVMMIIALLLIGGAIFALSGSSGFGKAYTVYADGEVLQVSGEFDTVQEVITAAVPDISPLDAVIPDRTSMAHPEVAISVQKAKPIVFETDTDRKTYFTHQTTLAGFLHEIRFNLLATDQITADGDSVLLFDLETTDLPQKLVIHRQMNVTISDDAAANGRQTIQTSGQTVADALGQVGLTLYAADNVIPPLDAWLTPNLEIRIVRSAPVTILADGRIIETRTPHSNVLQILANAGIALIGADYTIPAGDASISAGDTIQVVRVTEDFEFIDTNIPFESQLVASDQFEIDTRGLLQAGVPGILRQRIKIQLENGVEVGRVPDGEWVAQEPLSEQIGYGTKIVIRTIDTPEGPLEYYRKVEMRVTSYMAQTSGKAPDHPAYGITRSGVVAGYGVVAVDPKVVPFRSNVYVPGYGSAFVGDTGGGVLGRWIDLGYEDDWDTFKPWAGYIDVYYLTPVPEPGEINYLIPTVLP